MPRNHLLLLALSLTALPFSTASGRVLDQWNFDVYLNDSKIGEHRYQVTEENGAEFVRTNAKFKIKLLFITAFRYAHENTERWQGDCLTEIRSNTNSNGKRLSVAGELEAEGFALKTADSVDELPACVRSFAYWNLELLQAEQLLNPQSGEYVNVNLSFQGIEPIDVAGESIQAERYQLHAGGQTISLWYDQSGRWLGLEARLKKNRVLRYVIS